MREVEISDSVRNKITALESYLVDELKLSLDATLRITTRMRDFVRALQNEVDYPRCRFKKWRKLSYRCAVFEKDWVFAYEVFDDGVIVRDMSHTSLLKA
jgi:DNA polymerase IIIc chi subunit